MTTETIINRLYGIIELFPGTREDIVPLIAELEADLRTQSAKSAGNLNALKAINAILRECKKDSRESLHYGWIDSQERQCVCDGYQAYRMINHLPLEPRPGDAGEPVDLDKVIPADLTGWKTLAMPSAKTLREHIALERAKWQGRRCDFTPEWDFGEHAPTVNAQYLLNAATIFPNASHIMWNTLVSPLVIRCEDGDGVILPIRKANKTMPEPTEAERSAIDAEKALREKHNAEQHEKALARAAALEESSEAYGLAQNAEYAITAAESRAKRATTNDERRQAEQDAVNAGIAWAEAKLRYHKCMMMYDDKHCLDPDEFVKIVLRMNAVA